MFQNVNSTFCSIAVKWESALVLSDSRKHYLWITLHVPVAVIEEFEKNGVSHTLKHRLLFTTTKLNKILFCLLKQNNIEINTTWKIKRVLYFMNIVSLSSNTTNKFPSNIL